MAAYGNKSLEFRNGGNDVRVGIVAAENNTTSTSTTTANKPYYQAWPQYSVNQDIYLNFHASTPSSLSNEYLKLQHFLVGRAAASHYNATAVFPASTTKLIDGGTEDSFYTSVGTAAVPGISSAKACCIQDYGLTDTFKFPLKVWKFYPWSDSGGGNQTEFRWSHLLDFLERGWTGRYLDSYNFYRFQAGTAYPMSDGFDWRSHTSNATQAAAPRCSSGSTTGELSGFGTPQARSANCDLGSRLWHDQEHNHTYGILDYYFMTGDENANDGVEAMLDWAIPMGTYQSGANGGVWNARAVGVELLVSARLSNYLTAIGDTANAASVLAQGLADYSAQVAPVNCVSGYPAGCSYGGLNGPWTVQGISRTRGVELAEGENTSGSWCGVSNRSYRRAKPFMEAIMLQGILEFREAKTPAWSEWWNSLDLAYGVARWALSEMFVDDGSGRWDVNGFQYENAPDANAACNGPGESKPPSPNFGITAQQTVSGIFLAKYLTEGGTDWLPKFKLNLQKDLSALGLTTSDLGSYQLAKLIDVANNPGGSLFDTPITALQDNGGGSYTLSWVVPATTQYYRIKWAPTRIVDWIGFDIFANAFTGDPANTTAWFAASNAPNIPAPAAAGSTQKLTISTGKTGLTAVNFSVKSFVGSGGPPPPPPPPGPATTLLMVSGSAQTGNVGQALANPLTVKVTDAAGNPISGITVTFAVTAGGGSLSNIAVATSSQGLASTILTLGAAAGTNSVTASAGSLAGSPVTFTATATNPATTAKNLTTVSGNSQTGTAGQQLANPFVVKVTDANNNAVSGVSVVFAVTAGGGTLSGSTVNTNSSGQASTTLTLGATAGTNTVRATSGTLTGSPITFTATGNASPGNQTNVTWSRPPAAAGAPGDNEWFVTPYDPVSRQVVAYATLITSGSIYSTDLFFYNGATNTWTRLPGTGSTANDCPADTPTQPGNRHPIGQLAIDTKRNVLWLSGGVCMGNSRNDTYYLKLNPNPLDDRWTQVVTKNNPRQTTFSSMVYDPDDDLLFSFGYDLGAGTHDNWVFCRTAENPTPGTLTAKQSAAGCAAPDDWSEVAVAGGVRPTGDAFPGLVYDTVNKKVIQFGGESGGRQNQTWSYNVPTKTWTRKALSTAAPPVNTAAYWGIPAIAYNPNTGKMFYHQTGGTGAPADWEYDPVADTWTMLTSSGGGATNPQVLAYDVSRDVVLGFNKFSGGTEVWQAALSYPPPTVSAGPCDVNGDGVIDSRDVTAAINQSLGVSACSKADLNSDGLCNVIDVQRVVNASMGTACRTGQ